MSADRERPRRRDDVIVATAAGEGVFLLDPVHGEYFALDEVGHFIWSQCDGTRTVAEVGDLVRAAFADAPVDVADDVDELIRTLSEARLLSSADG